jgi:hypothetical protein
MPSGVGKGYRELFEEAFSPTNQWDVQHNPGANVIATISKAGVATQIHVVEHISITFAAQTTFTRISQVTCVLRDGASGSGAIRHAWVLSVSATNTGNSVLLSGLSIPMTAGNAATIEFTGAGGANTIEAVSISGYDVPA